MVEQALDIRKLWLFAMVAVVGASIPHYFFPTPLELHMQNNFRGWMGITVWAPAILGGMGFMLGADFHDRFERPASWFVPSGMAAGFAPMLLGMVIFGFYPWLSTDMAANRPWDELKLAAALYAGVGALQVPFWQGVVQYRLTAAWPAAGRVAFVAFLEMAIWLPFLHLNGLGNIDFLWIQFAAGALAALAFETGLSVRMVMLVRVLMGVSFAWFHQAMFL